MTLIEKIESTRQAMIEAGLHFGYTAKETVALSQELDQLLNKKMDIMGDY